MTGLTPLASTELYSTEGAVGGIAFSSASVCCQGSGSTRREEDGKMRRKAELWPLTEERQSFHDVTQEAPSRKRRITRNNRWAELKHKRILVVEDEPLQALHLATMIEEFGAEVAGIATSVQAALAEISVTSFDCATLDLKLHGFFSLGMVKGLRDMNIPFVVCTAYGKISDCLEDIPVIKKPITEEALAIALLKAMKGR